MFSAWDLHPIQEPNWWHHQDTVNHLYPVTPHRFSLNLLELMQMDFKQLVKITQKKDHTKLGIYQLSEFIFCVIIGQIFLFFPLILMILSLIKP